MKVGVLVDGRDYGSEEIDTSPNVSLIAEINGAIDRVSLRNRVIRDRIEIVIAGDKHKFHY